jgi:hypothetical protein
MAKLQLWRVAWMVTPSLGVCCVCGLPSVVPLQHPNLVHMLQTAEAMRSAGHPDWFQLVGLLHDMGKIMFLWGDRETGQEVRGILPQSTCRMGFPWS